MSFPQNLFTEWSKAQVSCWGKEEGSLMIGIFSSHEKVYDPGEGRKEGKKSDERGRIWPL